jgi:hypothetical protein
MIIELGQKLKLITATQVVVILVMIINGTEQRSPAHLMQLQKRSKRSPLC